MSEQINEPTYFKLYEDVSMKTNYKMSNVEWSMITLSSKADKDDYYGGMILLLDIFTKEKLMQSCRCSISKINHAITNLVKANIIRRVGNCLYQFNPYLIGKGEWEDILATREKWDKCVRYADKYK